MFTILHDLVRIQEDDMYNVSDFCGPLKYKTSFGLQQNDSIGTGRGSFQDMCCMTVHAKWF